MNHNVKKSINRAQKKAEKSKPELNLLGQDSNAFFILGEAQKVAKKNGMNWKKIEKEATSGDYHHLLATMMKHFKVS